MRRGLFSCWLLIRCNDKINEKSPRVGRDANSKERREKEEEEEEEGEKEKEEKEEKKETGRVACVSCRPEIKLVIGTSIT